MTFQWCTSSCPYMCASVRTCRCESYGYEFDANSQRKIIVLPGSQKKMYYVVLHFYPWFKFYFPLFMGMVIYDDDCKQREIKFKPRTNLTTTYSIKIN